MNIILSGIAIIVFAYTINVGLSRSLPVDVMAEMPMLVSDSAGKEAEQTETKVEGEAEAVTTTGDAKGCELFNVKLKTEETTLPPKTVAKDGIGSTVAEKSAMVISTIDYGVNPTSVLKYLVSHGAQLLELGTKKSDGTTPIKEWVGSGWVATANTLSGVKRVVSREASELTNKRALLVVPEAIWEKLTMNASGTTRLSLLVVEDSLQVVTMNKQGSLTHRFSL